MGNILKYIPLRLIAKQAANFLSRGWLVSPYRFRVRAATRPARGWNPPVLIYKVLWTDGRVL